MRHHGTYNRRQSLKSLDVHPGIIEVFIGMPGDCEGKLL